MELDAEALDGYRERFLQRMPDFADFTVREGSYWTKERAYKEEISALCKELLDPSAFDFDDGSTPDRVCDAVHRILTVRLASIRAPQNIVRWQEAATIRSYGDDQKQILATSLRSLLYGPNGPATKIDEFNRSMWPVFKGAAKGNPFARSRLIPTFFLMMVHPSEHVTVRTRLFDDVSMDFLGRSILDNQVMTGSEYLEILELCAAVRNQLERWGWCPLDMIDVQSFLWTACWDYEEESEADGEAE
jgi:hypothetical protein